MGNARQRTKAPRIIGKSCEPLTERLNYPIKRGENAVMNVFFPPFIPDLFDRVDFGTVRRLWDHTDSRSR